MNRELKQLIKEYIILIVGLAAGAFLFLLVWPDRYWLRVIAVVLGLFYLGWGLFTHHEAGHTSPRIFWEYAGAAALGATVLWLLA